MSKSLKVLQFIGFTFLVIIVVRFMAWSIRILILKYWVDTTIFSIGFWLLVTILYLVIGTALFGFILLLIRKINPYKGQRISLYTLIPVFVLFTLFNCYDVYDILRNYGLYWNDLSYFPMAFLLFLMIYMGFKMYSMLTKSHSY